MTVPVGMSDAAIAVMLSDTQKKLNDAISFAVTAGLEVWVEVKYPDDKPPAQIHIEAHRNLLP